MGHTPESSTRVFVHVADPERRHAIHAVLVAHGWTTVEDVDVAPPPQVLLVELGDRLGPVRKFAEALPDAVVLLLVDYLSPVVLVAAHTLRASAVLTASTPIEDLPLILAAHSGSRSAGGAA